MFRRTFLAAAGSMLVLTACGGAGSAEPVTVNLDVPEGGIATPIKQSVPLGSELTLVVTTAYDDDIHVHGYEHSFPTKAGEPHKITFTANMAGAYEIESHGANQVYMKLVVE